MCLGKTTKIFQVSMLLIERNKKIKACPLRDLWAPFFLSLLLLPNPFCSSAFSPYNQRTSLFHFYWCMLDHCFGSSWRWACSRMEACSSQNRRGIELCFHLAKALVSNDSIGWWSLGSPWPLIKGSSLDEGISRPRWLYSWVFHVGWR